MNRIIVPLLIISTLMLTFVASPLRADELADLRAKAATGGPAARIELAVQLIDSSWDGDGVAKVHEARDILAREAATGNAEAQYRLGDLLISKKIAAKEISASANASVKAKAALDKFKAERTQENMRAMGQAHIVAISEEQEKRAGQTEKERTEGLSWLRIATAQGHEDAALTLAETLTDDKDNPAQYQEGILLYRKLAEQSNPTALMKIAGEHLAAGQAPEAEKIYRTLAAKGNDLAMRQLADLLLAPARDAAARQEGIGLLKKFAESGAKSDQQKLVNYLLREGAPAAEEEAGLELLADYFETKKLEFAWEIFKKRLENGQTLPKNLAKLGDLYQAAKAGDIKAANMFGQAFLYGIAPFRQDIGAALTILDPVADNSKDISAMLLAGVAYSRRERNLFFNESYSERMFRKVAEAGHEELSELYFQACLLNEPAAMRLIAILRSAKNPLLEQSPAAFYWAGEGARQGDARAQQLLSYIYFSRNDLIEGLAWRKTAGVKLRWANPEKAAQQYKMTADQIAEADKLAAEYKNFSPAGNSYERRWKSRKDWAQRGNEHYDRGDDYLGILAYQYALRDTPDQADVMVDLATLYWRVGQKGIAIEVLEEVEMRYPDHLMGLYNLGLNYKQLKLNEECRRVWGRLLRKADPVKDAEMVAAVKEGLRELD